MPSVIPHLNVSAHFVEHCLLQLIEHVRVLRIVLKRLHSGFDIGFL